MKPVVLISATSHWFPTSRLAMALANAGCTIEAVCPPGHPLRKISVVRKSHKFSALLPLTSLRRAIETVRPQLIIPGDDLATRHLHHLYREQKNRNSQASEFIRFVIEQSFGSPGSFPVVYERATFMRLAGEEQVLVPHAEQITSCEDLQRWVATMGFPFVLKADGTSGGDGVRIVRTAAEAISAFKRLRRPPLLLRAAKRALVDGDRTLVLPSLLRYRSAISAQTFIRGHEATSTVACWKGTILAALHFEVIKKRSPSGPATVMRSIENPDMHNAVKKMVRRLSLSGIHGFDFMLEEHTGRGYLIEINPRTTQVGHLTLGNGKDLPAALSAVLKQQKIQLAPKLTDRDTIALFPQEWTRDPASDFIRMGYHDVPWEEPQLLNACIQHGLRSRQGRPVDNSKPFLSVAPAPPETLVLSAELKQGHD